MENNKTGLEAIVGIVSLHQQMPYLPIIMDAYTKQTQKPEHIYLYVNGGTGICYIEEAERIIKACPGMNLTIFQSPDNKLILGAGPARNRLINWAPKVDDCVMLFQDGDDLPSLDRVEVVCKFFKDNPWVVHLNHSYVSTKSLDALWCNVQAYDDFVTYDEAPEPIQITEVPTHPPYGEGCGWPVTAGSVCVRGSVLKTCRFPEQFGIEDYLFCCDVLRTYGASWIIPNPLLVYNISPHRRDFEYAQSIHAKWKEGQAHV